jgi:hypothetical protein
MPNLGDMFPSNFAQTFASHHQLSVGDVIYLFCDFTTPEKHKFMVVCCCEPLLVLLINSEISDYIQARPALLQCQVDLFESDHPFLEWDSFVNCIEAHQAFDLDAVKEQITINYTKTYKGRVANYCLRAIYEAVQMSETMLRKHKRLIVEAMQSCV